MLAAPCAPHKFLLQFLAIVKAGGLNHGLSMDTCGRLFPYDQGVSRSIGSMLAMEKIISGSLRVDQGGQCGSEVWAIRVVVLPCRSSGSMEAAMGPFFQSLRHQWCDKKFSQRHTR
jgi:hypothetical protein